MKRTGRPRIFTAAKPKRRKLPPRQPRPPRPTETAEQSETREKMAEGFAQAIGDFINALFGGHPRHAHQEHPQRSQVSKPATELEAELLREGYRKLAIKYHPDKGGDPDKMRELNRLKEKLGL